MTIRNVLYIMCDQLRWDHLGCAGHPFLRTPNIDALAARGVRFAQAYVQSGICGPSRMSAYTGRYVSSHGATHNRVPLSVGEVTLGWHLRESGRTLALAGKTHMLPDARGMKRLLLDGQDELAVLLREGWFTLVDRHDGHHAETDSAYADWLRAQGYDSRDPWTDYVIAVTDENGDNAEWLEDAQRAPSGAGARRAQRDRLHHRPRHRLHGSAGRPALGAAPVLCEAALALYRAGAVARDVHARSNACRCRAMQASAATRRIPVLREFQNEEVAQILPERRLHRDGPPGLSGADRAARPSSRPRDGDAGPARPMGRHAGRLHLRPWRLSRRPLARREGAVPRLHPARALPAGRSLAPHADATRGSVDDRFVEAIDVVPTILDALGLDAAEHVVEGRSLLPLTRGAHAGSGGTPCSASSTGPSAARGGGSA